MDSDSRRTKIVKFLIGLLLIGGLALCLGSGLTPPGLAGVVIRHNRDWEIDATALFYSDLENMQELERELAKTRAKAKPEGDSSAISEKPVEGEEL